ncbi:MAG: WD40 repeat domain-containing protein, partial [Paenibacillaceae bacterium]|nr:WD40 repeat domain-containing protein [Paenibacillaceae bacterium]
MNHHTGKYGFKLLAAALLSITVSACQSQPGDRLTVVDPGDTHRTGQQQPVRDGADGADGKRQLTVVRMPTEQAGRQVDVAGTHKIESARIQSWLSEDEVQIETIR